MPYVLVLLHVLWLALSSSRPGKTVRSFLIILLPRLRVLLLSVSVWSAACSLGWLPGWLLLSLIKWVTGWMVGWLVGCRFAGEVADRLLAGEWLTVALGDGVVDWWIECRLVDQPDGGPRQVSDQHEYLQCFPPLHLHRIVNHLWREKRECRVLPAVDVVTPLFPVCTYICCMCRCHSWLVNRVLSDAESWRHIDERDYLRPTSVVYPMSGC